jgi:hypothetical protein
MRCAALLPRVVGLGSASGPLASSSHISCALLPPERASITRAELPRGLTGIPPKDGTEVLRSAEPRELSHAFQTELAAGEQVFGSFDPRPHEVAFEGDAVFLAEDAGEAGRSKSRLARHASQGDALGAVSSHILFRAS